MRTFDREQSEGGWNKKWSTYEKIFFTTFAAACEFFYFDDNFYFFLCLHLQTEFFPHSYVTKQTQQFEYRNNFVQAF